MAEETEVLSLEAQSLSARVSAALQRGLNAAADDLAEAKRKNKRPGGVSPSSERGGVSAKLGGVRGNTTDDSSVSAGSVSSKHSTGSSKQSRQLFGGGQVAGGG